jgi:uncharacterized membrane protein YciS (DUF1049 family)
MKRILAWVIGLPVAVVLVAFAIANRQFVTVSLDPLSAQDPWIGLDLPLWSLLYIGIFVGLVSGWVAAWFNQHHWRKEARQSRQDLERARARIDQAERAERQNQLQPLDS